MVPPIRPELARRILWETRAVHDKFPGRFRLTTTAGLVAWEGCVPVEGQEFPVRVSYPACYPAQPPLLETTLPLPPHCPHVLRRRGTHAVLCWIAVGAAHPRRRWDPQRHTAATVLRAAQRWGLALLVWQTLGVWPIADAADL
jgi:hypothetical protein